MNLAQLRLEVRRALDGEGDNFWSDGEINDWLNEAAQTMVSIAQAYQLVHQFTTVANQQEYPLPPYVDEIFNVKIFNNTQRTLEKCSVTDIEVQEGGQRTGIPYNFYVNYIAGQVADQQSDGSLTINQVDRQDPTEARLVLGLHPVPDSAKTITIYYYGRHFVMHGDRDTPVIPPEFQRGLVAYAAALGKEKDSAFPEADRYMTKFGEYATKLRDKMISRGIEQGFPAAKIRDEEGGGFGQVTVYEASE